MAALAGDWLCCCRCTLASLRPMRETVREKGVLGKAKWRMDDVVEG